MIFGIGTDLVAVARIETALARHGERFAWRILAESERAGFRQAAQPAHYLAKRFAAKEAFGKALGTGVAVPATLHAVAVAHDPRGRPGYAFDARLSAHLAERGLVAHLSLSDEHGHALAFALLESVT